MLYESFNNFPADTIWNLFIILNWNVIKRDIRSLHETNDAHSNILIEANYNDIVILSFFAKFSWMLSQRSALFRVSQRNQRC